MFLSKKERQKNQNSQMILENVSLSSGESTGDFSMAGRGEALHTSYGGIGFPSLKKAGLLQFCLILLLPQSHPLAS